MYDESQRQLQITLDQYGASQRRLQSLGAELEDMRSNMEAVGLHLLPFSLLLVLTMFRYWWFCKALRGKRAVEQSLEECTARINELTTINCNLASTKSKLEQELAAYASDYEEATKELKVLQAYRHSFKRQSSQHSIHYSRIPMPMAILIHECLDV